MQCTTTSTRNDKPGKSQNQRKTQTRDKFKLEKSPGQRKIREKSKPAQSHNQKKAQTRERAIKKTAIHSTDWHQQ